MAYPDNMDIITTKADFRDAFKMIESSAVKKGLKINEDKTKFIVLGRYSYPHIQINNYNFERVGGSVYLGTYIDTENSFSKEIEKRIAASNYGSIYYG